MGKYRRYYKNYYNRDSYYNHTFYSHKDDSKAFVKNELFNLNKNAISILLVKYKNEFGNKAYNYFIEAFYKWKTGKVRISDQTMDRIIKYVPSLMSIDKQYELMKLEIINSLKKKAESTINSYKNSKISFDEFNRNLNQYLNEIHNYNKENIRWFIKNVFDENEINKFLSIYKNLLIIKIRYVYFAVKDEINLINIYLNKIENVYAEAFYTPEIINSKIDLYQNTKYDFNINFDSYIEEINLNNEDLKFYKAIERDIIDISIFKNESNNNIVINNENLKLLIGSYKKLINIDKEFAINQSFKGNGGKFNIILEKVSVIKLKINKIMHFSYIITHSIILILMIIFYFVNVKNACNGLAILLTITILIITVSHFKYQIEKINFFNNQIKKYVRN